MKFLLPRKIYYGRYAGTGWVGIHCFNPFHYHHVIISGYGFWKTLIYLIKWK